MDPGSRGPLRAARAAEFPIAHFMNAPVQVAVAILIRADGRVLLARRPKSKVYAGYWEFPGGKVEPGESVLAALARELREELGIDVGRSYPWITRIFTYPHALVHLHFYRVVSWAGEPYAHEHEGLSWEYPESISVRPLLPANGPVVRGLLLPHEYAISQADILGHGEFIARLRWRLSSGLKLVQLREPAMSRDEFVDLAREAVALVHRAGARILVNADAALARRVGADGVHLTSNQLNSLSARPELPLCGASCHTAAELRAAAALGADFAVLGSVCPTPTHPEADLLGWEKFRQLALDAALPVYALGGINRADLEAAWNCGAHGVAMVRGAWNRD